MTADESNECCPDTGCCSDQPQPLSLSSRPPEHDLVPIPADKALPDGWPDDLYRRGEPTTYRGEDLTLIGMPVGGGCSGQLYLGGDGRLWHFDIVNGEAVGTWAGAGYTSPRQPSSPIRHGFALRTRAGGRVQTRRLDATGFDDVSFTGQYPIGRVDYRADDAPVEVALEAFSPFVPLSVADSTIPATVLAYTVRNTSDETVDATLLGYLENPVCLNSRAHRAVVLTSEEFREASLSGLLFSAHEHAQGDAGPDIVVEDWAHGGYDGWTVAGAGFGTGPAAIADLPEKMRSDLNATGARIATSYRAPDTAGHGAAADGGDAAADGGDGRLVSRPFTVERRYLKVAVGGGSRQGEARVNVLVDGVVVATATPREHLWTAVTGTVVRRHLDNLETVALNVAAYQGRGATIEIVDRDTPGADHLNVGPIVLSDVPVDTRPLDEVPDYGTLALAVVAPHAVVQPSLAAWADLDDVFASRTGPDHDASREPHPDASGPGADGPVEVDASLAGQAGSVSATVRLAPGQSETVRFVLGWHFSVPDRAALGFLTDATTLRRHYATRFADARAVVRHVAADLPRLEADTRRWVDTWYTDSTLPHWFLERTLAPASTLATATCHLFDDGRFYGWEGVYCCAGTCEHVWNYAQSIARLFPDLERDTRSRVDLGIAFHADTGQIGYRAEANMTWAADGQCGTILRCWREHLTAPDDSFLRAHWPRLKQALRWVISHDADRDGALDGAQPNTLDSAWYGQIAWITGMYVAALRAGAAMAEEMGDAGFADECRTLAEAGSRTLCSDLFNGEYFVHEVDPAHPEAANTNQGCHIDQLFGQSLAGELNLGRVIPAEYATTALRSLYRYNFTPDHSGFRQRDNPIPGGRWFAMDHEYGMVMTTWPRGGADRAAGSTESWAVGYFNEVWTGQEYQVAAHMLQEGLVDEGLTMARAVHERYAAGKRNPYNEVECGDHYARAMASHGVYLAACGFEYHGPRGHLGFAPRVRPERFAAAFTAAEGWGLYRQTVADAAVDATVEVRYGRLRLESLALAVPEPSARVPEPQARVAVRLGDQPVEVRECSPEGGRLLVTFEHEVVVECGQRLTVVVSPG